MKKPGRVEITTVDNRLIERPAHQVIADAAWLRIYLAGDETGGVPAANISEWRWLKRPS